MRGICQNITIEQDFIRHTAKAIVSNKIPKDEFEDKVNVSKMKENQIYAGRVLIIDNLLFAIEEVNVNSCKLKCIDGYNIDIVRIVPTCLLCEYSKLQHKYSMQ